MHTCSLQGLMVTIATHRENRIYYQDGKYFCWDLKEIALSDLNNKIYLCQLLH